MEELSFYPDRDKKTNKTISNQSQFRKCKTNQSEKFKKKNNLIQPIFNNNMALFKKLKRVDAFNNDHLYGLPKIHQN